MIPYIQTVRKNFTVEMNIVDFWDETVAKHSTLYDVAGGEKKYANQQQNNKAPKLR